MKLAGLEAATSWVRFKWPIGHFPPAVDSWSVADPAGIRGAARRGFWTPNWTPSGKLRRDDDRRSYLKHFRSGALQGQPGSSSNGEARNRTGDTTIFSRVLYQLSYLAAPADGSETGLLARGPSEARP